MGGKAFKRGMVYSVATTIMDFVPLLKSFIANVLKCKAHLKTNLHVCVCYCVFLSDESLLTWLYKNGNRLIKVSAVF